MCDLSWLLGQLRRLLPGREAGDSAPEEPLSVRQLLNRELPSRVLPPAGCALEPYCRPLWSGNCVTLLLGQDRAALAILVCDEDQLIVALGDGDPFYNCPETPLPYARGTLGFSVKYCEPDLWPQLQRMLWFIFCLFLREHQHYMFYHRAVHQLTQQQLDMVLAAGPLELDQDP